MKTIIKIRTWSCPCGYHQDFEPTPELMSKHFKNSVNVCPSCKKSELIKEKDNDKKIVMTVVGEEDIDTEIVELDKKAKEEGKSKMTKSEKDAHKLKRKDDIAKAIIEAKKYEDK